MSRARGLGTDTRTSRFNIILDGAKSGDIIKEAVFRDDRKKWNAEIPYYAIRAQKKKGKQATFHGQARVPPERFILDWVFDKASDSVQKHFKKYDESRAALQLQNDTRVARPWIDFCERVAANNRPSKDEMVAVRDTVLKFCEDLRPGFVSVGAIIAKAMDNEKSGFNRKDDLTTTCRSAAEKRRAIRAQFLQGPTIATDMYDAAYIRTLTASCAFWIDAVRPKEGSSFPPDPKAKFAFGVAFAQLCDLQAQLSGSPHQTLLEDFLNHMPIRVK